MKVVAQSLVVLLFLSACAESEPAKPLPAPTQVAPNVEEGSDEGFGREAWIESMHRTAPGVSWTAIEAANDRAARARLARFTGLQSRSNTSFDSIAPGLNGRWHERGSRNQAGSVLATAYYAPTDELYAVSAGGTLWAGPSDGSAWRVVEQDVQFDDRFLGIVESPNGGPRIIASIATQPAYSDDDGATWNVSDVVNAAGGFWSFTRDYATAMRGDTIDIYALNKPGYWDDYQVLYSADLGETWSLLPLNTELSSGNNDVDLFADPAGNGVYLINRTGELLRLTPHGDEQIGAFSTNLNRVNLTGSNPGDSLTLYVYDIDNRVHVSRDTGSTWSVMGDLPERPWQVGIYAHPYEPNKILMGEVEAFRSEDGGESFTLVNPWGAYYSDVEGSLHADMMTFNTFVKTDGSTFTISANHGGLNRTESWFAESRNIGMEGLNVGQFYSVTSHPNYPGYMFGGTQDQGYQMARGDSSELLAMDQIISGDYGHLTFTRDGSQLWMMYPGTAVSVYTDPTSPRWYDDWLTIRSEDETVWLAPMSPHPDSNQHAIIAAGGSVVDGGEGSFLLTYTYEPGGSIQVTEGDFDFKLESAGGELSAVEISPLSNDRIYAATTNGRFFVSPDQGETWEQSISFIPEGNYLYGQAIAASPVSDSTVWLGGSGYSGPGIWRSDDAGQNFVPDVDGLPNTMTFELATSPDGKWLFAATEAGPYAQDLETRTWYPLQLPGVPTQTYWSVDYVEPDSIVRFATYGRGIWDLQLGENAPVSVGTRDVAQVELRLFPNPAQEFFQVEAPGRVDHVDLLTAAGQRVLQQTGGQRQVRVDIATVPPGLYFAVITSEGKQQTKQLIIR